MRSSPKHSPLVLHTSHTEIVDSLELDETRSPHAIDCRDPNYDPFDDEEGNAYVDFYLIEESENLGTLPYHVVRSTKSTPGKNPAPISEGYVRNKLEMLQDPAGRRSNSRFNEGHDSSLLGSTKSVYMSAPPMSLSEFKSAVTGILEEMFDSNDFAIAVDRINATNCKLYHDEFLAHAIRLSLDRSNNERDKIAELITLMRKSGHVTVGQLSRAFEKLFLTWEDILLDVPDAPSMILKFVELAISDGVLPAGFVAKLPQQFLTTVAAIEPCVEEFPEIVQQLVNLIEFKNRSTDLIDEYLASEGGETVSDMAERIKKLRLPNLHHEFVRRAINKSLDRNDHERELVSKLLTGLRDLRVLTEDDFLWGFSHMIGGIEDLSIDCPNVVELISKFLIRAVTDEVIPPSFLDNAVRLGLGGPLGTQATAHAKSTLENTQVEWVELRNVWNDTSVDQDQNNWKKELDIALNEYLASHDKAEFCRQLHDWALCTSRAVSLIKFAILKAMDRSGSDCMAIVDLIQYAVQEAEELKANDITRALAELDTSANDLKLDIPDFEAMLNSFGGLFRTRDLIPLVSSPRASSTYNR